MDALLQRVLDAHGGLHNWSKVTGLTVQLSLDGPFWDGVGWPQIRRRQTVTLDTRREHLTITPFTGDRLSAVFDGEHDRVEIHDAAGKVLEQRDTPRASFPPFDPASTRWDRPQLAYFLGAANWNYFVEPFLFTYPGVEAHEIEPWPEAGEIWRSLAVTFPANLPNHNPDQTFYFDDTFMQRRMDYSPDVTSRAPVAHYTYDPKVFDGFVFYPRRRVHHHDANGITDQSFTPITIETHTISIERQ